MRAGFARSIAAVLLALAFSSVTATPGSADNALGPVHYNIQIGAGAQDADLFVNDVLIRNVALDKETVFVTQFLTNGPNTVRVVWRNVKESPYGLRVALVRRGPEPDPERAVFEFDAPADDTIGVEREKTFNVDVDVPYKWIWERAARAGEITERDREKILGIVGRLYRTLADRDVRGNLRISRHELWEMGLAKHADRDWFYDKMKAVLEANFKDEDWGMKPLDLRQVELTAYSRLIRVTNGDHIMQSYRMANGWQVSIRVLYFAKLRGRWELVR